MFSSLHCLQSPKSAILICSMLSSLKSALIWHEVFNLHAVASSQIAMDKVERVEIFHAFRNLDGKSQEISQSRRLKINLFLNYKKAHILFVPKVCDQISVDHVLRDNDRTLFVRECNSNESKQLWMVEVAHRHPWNCSHIAVLERVFVFFSIRVPFLLVATG